MALAWHYAIPIALRAGYHFSLLKDMFWGVSYTPYKVHDLTEQKRLSIMHACFRPFFFLSKNTASSDETRGEREEREKRDKRERKYVVSYIHLEMAKGSKLGFLRVESNSGLG